MHHIKSCLLGHWGTIPAINFIYAHLNRAIQRLNLNIILLTGPDHSSPTLVANTYLEGTYSEFYPDFSQNTQGIQQLFRQFSFPSGIGNHATPETPGSIHEGSELGYVLSHAFGAVFDNPDLIAACVVGDDEAETGSLATTWHANKFLNPAHDGAMLPILHLNNYKNANPTILARISREELMQLFQGYEYRSYVVEGEDGADLHQQMACILDRVVSEIRTIQQQARQHGNIQHPRWLMIILAHVQKLDRPKRGRWPENGRQLALPAGAVCGHTEDGTITTPFDRVVRNDLDRFHLINDVIDWVPKLSYTTAYLKQIMRDKLIEHHEYIHHHGQDLPEIRNWKWTHL